MLCLNPERLDTQDVRADLALYLGSKLKLEQEEGLKGAQRKGMCMCEGEREKLPSNSFELNMTKLVLTA